MHYLLITVCTVACLRSGARAKPLSDNTLDSGYKPETAESDLHKLLFSIPSRLKQEYEITVTGKIKKNRKRLTFSLVTGSKEKKSPDFKNVACQLMADFVEDKVTLNEVVNGNERRSDEDMPATELFHDSNFTVIFIVEKEKSIRFNVGASATMNSCKLEHEMDNILFLTVGGDVDKVEKIEFLLA